MILGQIVNYGFRTLNPYCVAKAIDAVMDRKLPTFWMVLALISSVGEGLGRTYEWWIVQELTEELLYEKR